jgi:hypothetical protein
MSYEAKIVKMDGSNKKVHFSNGKTQSFDTTREYREFLRFYSKKQSDQKQVSKKPKKKKNGD